MKTVIFPKSGKLMLTKYVSGALTPSVSNSVYRGGGVQSIQESITKRTTDLPDGNSDFPLGTYDVGTDGKVTVVMSSFSAALYAFLLGVSVSSITAQQMWDIDKSLLIPSASPFSVTLLHTPRSGGTIMLVDDGASAWTQTGSVSAVPATTQYTVSQTIVSFNSADAGKNVFVTYDYSADASEVGVPKAATRTQMQCIISGEATSEDESTTYDVNVVIDKCKSSGEMSPPSNEREPKTWTFTLSVLKPRGDNKAVDFFYAPRT